MTRIYKLFILVALAIVLFYMKIISSSSDNIIVNSPLVRSISSDSAREKPTALFGIIADVQYADLDDRVIYGRTRYYRSGIKIIRQAVDDWKTLEKTYHLDFKFVLQLGDLIDIRGHKDVYDKSVIYVLNELNSLFPDNDLYNSHRILHLIGNHETAAFTNKSYQNKMSKLIMNTARILNNDTNTSANYYFLDINEKLRLVCLDLYEISLYDTHTEEFKQNYNNLVNLNKNSTDKKSAWARYNMYNGALSRRQVDWLRRTLNSSESLGKKVIMAGHIPLLTDVGDINIAWNAEEILKLIRSYKSLVVAYIAGHYHCGGYFRDEFGVHHLTVSSILEAGHNFKHRYVTGLVYENKLVIKSQNLNRSFVVYF